MTIKVEVKVRELEVENKALASRLDKLEKTAIVLKKAVSHLERSPKTESGVTVPQTPLPETLDQLEIGSQPKGT